MGPLDGVNQIPGARVCIKQGDDVYAVGRTTASNGQVVFTDIAPRSTDDMILTITADGYMAYQDTIPVSGKPATLALTSA